MFHLYILFRVKILSRNCITEFEILPTSERVSHRGEAVFIRRRTLYPSYRAHQQRRKLRKHSLTRVIFGCCGVTKNTSRIRYELCFGRRTVYKFTASLPLVDDDFTLFSDLFYLNTYSRIVFNWFTVAACEYNASKFLSINNNYFSVQVNTDDGSQGYIAVL